MSGLNHYFSPSGGASVFKCISIDKDSPKVKGKVYKNISDAVSYVENNVPLLEQPSSSSIWCILGGDTENAYFPNWIYHNGLGFSLLSGEVTFQPIADVEGEDVAVNGDWENWTTQGELDVPVGYTFLDFLGTGADIEQEDGIVYDENDYSVKINGFGFLYTTTPFTTEAGKSYRVRTWDYGDAERGILFYDKKLTEVLDGNVYIKNFGWQPFYFGGDGLDLSNPDFENWTDEGGGEYSADNWTVLSGAIERAGDAQSGTYCVKLLGGGLEDTVLACDVITTSGGSALIPGDTVSIDINYKKDALSAGDSLWFVLVNGEADTFTQIYDYKNDVWIDGVSSDDIPEDALIELWAEGTDWTNDSKSVLMPLSGEVSIVFINDANNIFYVDNITSESEGTVPSAVFGSGALYDLEYGSNTLSNGDFEDWTGSDADGWSVSNATLVQEAVIKYEGSYSGKMTGTGADNYYIIAPLDESYSEGDKVKATLRIAADPDSSSNYGGCIFLNDVPASATHYWDRAANDWNGGWTEFTTLDDIGHDGKFDFNTELTTEFQLLDTSATWDRDEDVRNYDFVTVDSGEKIQLVYYIDHVSPGSAIHYIDDVQIVEATKTYDWKENLIDTSVPSPLTNTIAVQMINIADDEEEGETNYIGQFEFFEYEDASFSIYQNKIQETQLTNLVMGENQYCVFEDCILSGCTPTGGCGSFFRCYISESDLSNLEVLEAEITGLDNEITLSFDSCYVLLDTVFPDNAGFRNCALFAGTYGESKFFSCGLENCSFNGDSSFFTCQLRGNEDFSFDDSTFYFNNCVIKGINPSSGTFYFENCTFLDNLTASGTAAIYTRNCAPTTITLEDAATWVNLGTMFNNDGTSYASSNTQGVLEELDV